MKGNREPLKQRAGNAVTPSYDRGTKFDNFQSLPSVREYIHVSQDKMCVERFVRQPDEQWLLTTFDDAASEFSLATIVLRIRLTDVYRGVQLPEEPLI